MPSLSYASSFLLCKENSDPIGTEIQYFFYTARNISLNRRFLVLAFKGIIYAISINSLECKSLHIKYTGIIFMIKVNPCFVKHYLLDCDMS